MTLKVLGKEIEENTIDFISIHYNLSYDQFLLP